MGTTVVRLVTRLIDAAAWTVTRIDRPRTRAWLTGESRVVGKGGAGSIPVRVIWSRGGMVDARSTLESEGCGK